MSEIPAPPVINCRGIAGRSMIGIVGQRLYFNCFLKAELGGEIQSACQIIGHAKMNVVFFSVMFSQRFA